MKPDGLILASLPSSGSDWIADCIRSAHPELSYCREYFSATVNWRRTERIGQVLGDTLFSTVSNLCREISWGDLDTLLNETWRRDGFTFTKENYIPFQLERFAETFDIIVLVRRFEDTFPPHRHRVMRWYDAFHGGLDVAGLLDSWCRERSRTPMNRAAIGHYWFSRRLVVATEAIKAPVLWFHELTQSTEDDLRKRIGSSVIDIARVSKLITESRQERSRPEGEWREQWADARNLYREIENRYGRVWKGVE